MVTLLPSPCRQLVSTIERRSPSTFTNARLVRSMRNASADAPSGSVSVTSADWSSSRREIRGMRARMGCFRNSAISASARTRRSELLQPGTRDRCRPRHRRRDQAGRCETAWAPPATPARWPGQGRGSCQTRWPRGSSGLAAVAAARCSLCSSCRHAVVGGELVLGRFHRPLDLGLDALSAPGDERTCVCIGRDGR